MLCDTCRLCLQSELDRGNRSVTPETTHHVSRESITFSILEGCILCVSIERRLNVAGSSVLFNSGLLSGTTSSDFPSKLRVNLCCPDGSKSRSYVVYPEVYLGELFFAGERFCVVESSRKCLHRRSNVPFINERAGVDYLQPQIEQQPCTKSSDQGRQLVMTWFKWCQNHHVKCNANRSTSWCPSRLLDLTSLEEGQIRLISSTCKRVHRQYMTLSHRLGVKPTIQLTSKNETWMSSGFSVSHLPQTFLDAAELVRKLGASYLWIDSLCIQQDRVEDWQQESNQMGDVYKFSLCNIGATGSTDENDGLRWVEGPPKARADGVELHVDGLRASFSILPLDLRFRLDHEMLNKRAWVLQERYLAPSMIHFASEELFWEIQEVNACQSFPFGIPNRLLGSTLHGERIRPGSKTLGESCHENKASDPSSERLNALSKWHALCKMYTKCELTRPEDKLVALSGLANEFQRSIKANYLAGLWDFVLVPQLLWDIFQAKEPVVEYRAPSWSWASVQSPHGSTGHHLGYDLIDILESSVENAGYHSNGAVRSGVLKVRGSVLAVKLHCTPKDPPDKMTRFNANANIIIEDLTGNKVDIYPALDTTVTSAFFENDYVCLPLQYYFFYMQTEDTERPTTRGLILESEGNTEGFFRRVGMFCQFEKKGVASAFRTDLISKQILYIV